MNLLPMVARNFKARRMRTALTLFGIAVGVMAIVALMGLSRGFERGWDQTMNARGTDAVINRAAAGSPIPAPFSEDIAASIRSCLLYTSPSPRDKRQSRMPSSA